MQQSPPPGKQPSRLSGPLQQRLNAYALAASAAGVSLLAFAQPAEGRIVYHRASHRFRFGFNYYYFDINHDGVADFVFHQFSAGNYYSFTIQPATSQNQNLIWGYKTTYRRFASALGAGVKVHASKKLGNGKNEMMTCAFHTSISRNVCDGQWYHARDRYLGLKFYEKGKAHYGWARLTVKGIGSTQTLTGYAYETIPDKPIITGKTHGPDVITLQSATLGHLARGASAVEVWRQKEAVEVRH